MQDLGKAFLTNRLNAAVFPRCRPYSGEGQGRPLHCGGARIAVQVHGQSPGDEGKKHFSQNMAGFSPHLNTACILNFCFKKKKS